MARDSLLHHYTKTLVIPLAQRRMQDQFSLYGFNIDQLIQEGRLAVFDRMQAFDYKRGGFVTFAKPRINGSFEDLLRREGAIPRPLENSIDKYNEAVEQVNQNDYDASKDLRIMTGLSKKKFKRAEAFAHVPLYVSYDVPQRSSHNPNKQIKMDFESEKPGPAEAAVSVDIREYLMRGLDRRERLVVRLHYYEGLTMREIGNILGISSSMASLINRDVLKRWRERLPEIKRAVA